MELLFAHSHQTLAHNSLEWKQMAVMLMPSIHNQPKLSNSLQLDSFCSVHMLRRYNQFDFIPPTHASRLAKQQQQKKMANGNQIVCHGVLKKKKRRVISIPHGENNRNSIRKNMAEFFHPTFEKFRYVMKQNKLFIHFHFSRYFVPIF